MTTLRELERVLRLPGRVVAEGGVEQLADAHQIFERAHRFLKRRERVRLVQVQDLDPIGAQALQARFDRTADMAVGLKHLVAMTSSSR